MLPPNVKICRMFVHKQDILDENKMLKEQVNETAGYLAFFFDSRGFCLKPATLSAIVPPKSELPQTPEAAEFAYEQIKDLI